MAQIPILSGITADERGRWRTRYPRNLVPVPKQTGVSEGHLEPADGILTAVAAPGIGRGGFVWNGVMYRVMGTKLVRMEPGGTLTTLGDVGGTGQVTMDAGFDRLAIWSNARLWYWNGTALTQVADEDLGNVIDGRWIAGYFVSTDGTSLIATDINDPTSINPLRYGSSEADPDPIQAVDELRNELYALNRYTIEPFRNVGGEGFPFRRIDGGLVPRGVVGTHAYAQFLETFAFVGGARNEAPGVWLMGAGTTSKISTAEVDRIIGGFTEAEQASIVVETRIDAGHQHLMIHLPDRCIVYDAAASSATRFPVWFTLDSGFGAAFETYRARNLTRWNGAWYCDDPTSAVLGKMTDTTMEHHGNKVAWDFGTIVLHNAARSALVHELELVALPGRVAFGKDPTIWTSASHDGETWSQERPISAGKQGERGKRLVWRQLGQLRGYRMQRFRGTSDARISFSRLEAQLEALAV